MIFKDERLRCWKMPKVRTCKMDNLILNHVYLSIYTCMISTSYQKFMCLFSMHHRTATLLVAWRIITPSTTCREFFAVQEAPKWTTSLRIPPPQTRVLLGHLPTPLSLGKKVDIFHLKVDIFHLNTSQFRTGDILIMIFWHPKKGHRCCEFVDRLQSQVYEG